MTTDAEKQRRQRAAKATRDHYHKPEPHPINWDEAIARIRDYLDTLHPRDEITT
jgi:hypothetical protein